MAALTQPKIKGGSWLACDSHRYLHNSEAIDGNHDAKRAALDLDLAFDLKRPVKPRWPNAGLKSWATRRDAGLAAPRHGWRVAATHDFKPAFGHTEPRRGAEWWGEGLLVTFGWAGMPAFTKKTCCKSRTLGGRYRSNGYVLSQQKLGFFC